MKTITTEEFDSLRGGNWSDNPVVKEVLKMKAGEALFIEKEEWKPKTDFAAYIGQMKRRHLGMNWTVRKTKEGWAIKRIS